jgi:hypothetical protein
MEQSLQHQKPQMEQWQSNKSSEQLKRYYLGYNTGFCGCCIDEELESDPDYVDGWEHGFFDRRIP